MAGRELQRPAPDGERRRDRVEGQERFERVEVDLAPRQRLQFGGEGDQASLAAVIERLDPETVAGEHDSALSRVPEREREHAAQLTHECGAVLLVEVDEHLGVALRRKTMAASFQPGPELAVVVDLSVLNDLDRAVLVPDRLVAALEVDDGKAPRRERDGPVDEAPLAVGAAVTQALAHRRE